MRQGLAFIPHWVLAPDFHEMSCQGELGDSLRAVFACTRGENRLSGGLTLLLFLRLSVSAVCPSSMAVAGAGTVVYLLGSFCFLGEQFQECATVPKDLRRRGFQEKKKKKSFQLLWSLLPRAPFFSAVPTSGLNQSRAPRAPPDRGPPPWLYLESLWEPHPGPVKLESLGMGQGNPYFKNLSR